MGFMNKKVKCLSRFEKYKRELVVCKTILWILFFDRVLNSVMIDDMINKKGEEKMNEVIKQLYERKSVRVFEETLISDNDKRMIIESAIQAPTAGNQCMYTIIDVTDQNLLAKLAESCDHQPFIKDAKLALIFVADFQKWYDAFKIVDEKVRTPRMEI